MKARDLAALAALGIAGKYAFDKFGNKKKDDEPKKKMGEGLDMTNQGAYERATTSKSADADVEMGTKGAYLPETAELRTKGAYLDDTPELRTKGAYLDESATPVAKNAVVKKKDVAVKKKDAVEEVAPAPVSKTRAFTPPGAQDSMGAFTNAGQTVAAAPETRAFTPPGYVASANDYNRASTTNTPSNAALGDYARAINPAMHADRMLGASHPSAKITDKLAVDSRANQAAALAKKQAEQARIDALRSSGGRRAKGGMVKKMASGGMTSSKMSKPSGASRGDGIAQRGRTRGTLR
jgi:hypothetical protein